MEKEIGEMTEKEILRRQLELMAEKSKSAEDSELQGLTLAMTDIVYSIDRISQGEVSAKKTASAPAAEEFKTEQQYILHKFNESAKVQKTWIRVQIICLIGMLINSISFLIYLVGHL